MTGKTSQTSQWFFCHTRQQYTWILCAEDLFNFSTYSFFFFMLIQQISFHQHKLIRLKGRLFLDTSIVNGFVHTRIVNFTWTHKKWIINQYFKLNNAAIYEKVTNWQLTEYRIVNFLQQWMEQKHFLFSFLFFALLLFFFSWKNEVSL